MPRSVFVSAALATASSGQLSFAAPLERSAKNSGGSAIVAGPLCPGSVVARKAAMTKALAHVARGSSAVWDFGHASNRTEKLYACPEVTLPKIEEGGEARGTVTVMVPVRIDGRTKDNRPVVTLVKAEYSCKGYNTLPDDAAEVYRLEKLTKRELATVLITLTLLPDAEFHVLRVNAYTHALLAVEVHTLSSASKLAAAQGDEDLAGVWASAAAVTSLVQRQSSRNDFPADAFVVKKAQSRDILVIARGNAISGTSAVATVAPSIAPYSSAAPKTEYLPQVNWPLRERIPFTFPPMVAATPGHDGTAEGYIHTEVVVAPTEGSGTEDLAVPFTLHRQPSSVAKRAR